MITHNPGMYRNTILFQEMKFTKDDYLNSVENPRTIRKARVKVNNSLVTETEGKTQVYSETEIVIETRWCKFFEDLDTKKVWITFKGKKYNILSVDNVQYKNQTAKIKASLREG